MTKDLKDFVFTKQELFEIEKVFDILASKIPSEKRVDLINMLSRMSVNTESSKEFINKLLDEDVSAYSLYREISAKAQNLREEK